MLKKLRSIVALLLVASLCTACSGNKDNNSSTTGGTDETGTTQQGSGVFNDYGWEVPTETFEFTVFMGEGDQNEWDSSEGKKNLDEFLLREFNVKINKVLYALDMSEKLNLMLAANDYPEVITWMPDEMAAKFVSQKRTRDLTTLVREQGNNFTQRLGNYLNLLKEEDGTLHKLPIYWGKTPNVAGYDFAARYDLWQETGLPMYETLDDYFNVMQAIVAAHPTNANGEKTYAFTANASDNTNGAQFYQAMLSAYGFKNGFDVADDGTFTHWMNTNEGLEIAQYINKFYRAGLIDPDFVTTDYETFVTKAFNERVVGNIGTWWHVWTGGHEKWVQEDPNYTVEKRFMNATVAVEGVDEPTYLASNFLSSYRAIITNKADNSKTEQIFKWLNWEASVMGNFIIGYGEPCEGNVWDIKDGMWIFDDETMDSTRKNEFFHNVREKYGANEYAIVGAGGLLEDERIDPRVTRVSTYDYWPIDEKGDFTDPGVQICWANVTAEPWDATLFQVSYNPQEEVATINQTIKDSLVVHWVKMITASTAEECENLFMSARDDLNAKGLDKLTQYNQQEYEKNVEKVKNPF